MLDCANKCEAAGTGSFIRCSRSINVLMALTMGRARTIIWEKQTVSEGTFIGCKVWGSGRARAKTQETTARTSKRN